MEQHLPYAGTSGWSGSAASQDRAKEADESGETGKRQAMTVSALRDAGVKGLTWKDLGAIYGWHHGKATGVLSVLHKDGVIARLADERRDRCSIYVSKQFLNGRPVAAHGRSNPTQDTLQEWLARDASGWSKAGRDPKGFVKAMRAVTGIGT